VFESQAKYIISNWASYEVKIFKYMRFPLPNEFVVLNKDTDVIRSETGDYKSATVFVSNKKSTFLLPNLTESAILSMIVTGELVYERDFNEYVDVIRMKTGGCTCGIWVMGLNESTYNHSSFCTLYKDPNEKKDK
jgi:hypothetical protein